MSETEPTSAARARWTLLAVVVLFVAPLLVAVGWYAFAPQVAPSAAAHGALIDPARPLEPFELAGPGSAQPFTLDDLRGNWTMLHVIDSACSAACRQRLYYTRQIHTALDKDQGRVQRVAWASAGSETAGLAAVIADHPGLTVLGPGRGRPLRRQLPADLEPETVLLIDPLGNLMLRFGANVEPGGILEDLEKLLKLSRVG